MLLNFYHNLSLGMNLAQSYRAGIGWGWRPWQKLAYTLAADVRYLGEDLYVPGKPLSLAVAGFLEQSPHTFRWPGDGLTFTNVFCFSLPLTIPTRFRSGGRQA